MDHTVLPANLSLSRKRSPDGGTTERGDGHLITAYYSFNDPERMKGRVSLVAWLTYSNGLVHISGQPAAAGRGRTGKVFEFVVDLA